MFTSEETQSLAQGQAGGMLTFWSHTNRDSFIALKSLCLCLPPLSVITYFTKTS